MVKSSAIHCLQRVSIILVAVAAGVSFILPHSAIGGDLFSAMGVIGPKVRVEAPAFTLTDVDGRERSLDDFKGKVILLNFWATWCAPCRDELPAMEALWRRFEGKGFTIVAVAGDRGKMHRVGEFCKMNDVTFTVFLDPTGKVRKEYEVSALPTSYLIGRDGKIVGKIMGAREWDSSEAVRLVANLLEP
ncbi:MAG: TlpA disulfide reductase family protein [Thermodesulfobacteriota bacterium]